MVGASPLSQPQPRQINKNNEASDSSLVMLFHLYIRLGRLIKAGSHETEGLSRFSKVPIFITKCHQNIFQQTV